MDALPGVPVVSKNQNFLFTKKTVEFFLLILPQKDTNFEKSSKLKKKSKNPVFLVFQIFFNLGANLKW